MSNLISERLFFFLYRALFWPALYQAFRVLSLFNPKIRQGLKMRAQQNGVAPWLNFPKLEKPIWFHVASGEFEYAKPVITALKKKYPTQKILVTYFSPSVARAATQFPGVDFACPSPWERPSDLQAFLAHHKPKALLVARTDAWPEMLRQAKRAGVPSLLFSATLAAESGRAKGLGKIATRITLGFFDSIYCVTQTDREVLEKTGLTSAHVQGDTRYDQVLVRLSAPKPIKESLFRNNDARKTLVAGSTWNEDEAALIPSLSALRGHLRTILVPHEPTPEHISELELTLREHSLTWVRYSQSETWTTEDILLVDQVGILAELYQKGRLALVGGSFRKSVHSVMEPLAAGNLVLVGPAHRNNREALEFATLKLSENSGLTMVQPVRDARALLEKLQAALAVKESAAPAILAEVQKRCGSTERVVEWIEHSALNKAT